MSVNNVIEEVVRHVCDSEEARPGIAEVLKESLNGNLVFLSAPPGYGKTTVPYSLGLLSSRKLLPQTIHALPMRSIIDDVYERLFVDEGKEPKHPELNRLTVGRQMLGLSESPHMQKPLLLTTVDSFIMTLLKIPPGDLTKIILGVSLGHGEYSRSLTFQATLVFDEVQLFLEDLHSVPSLLKSVLRLYCSLKSPVIVMTATLPQLMLNFLSDVTLAEKVKVLRYGKEFRDENFEAKKLSNKIKTEKVEGDLVDEAFKTVKEEAWDKVAIVTNTIKRAVATAKKLEEECKPIVIHGKIKVKDRKERLKEARKAKKLTLVSTQVIEAGVNLSFKAMVSDASTPSSLIQRFGRILRWEENEEGLAKVVYEYSSENQNSYHVYPLNLVRSSFKNLDKQIVWHIPQVQNGFGYEKFMEKAYLDSKFSIKEDKYISDTFEHWATSLLLTPREIQEGLFQVGGSLLRDSPLILAFISEPEEVNVKDKLEESIPLSYQDILHLRNRKIKGLYLTHQGFKVEEAEKTIKKISRGIYDWDVFKLIGLFLSEEDYDEEYGLKLSWEG